MSCLYYILFIDEETGESSNCETNDTLKDSSRKLQVSFQKIFFEVRTIWIDVNINKYFCKTPI